jgi:hypothetical protein
VSVSDDIEVKATISTSRRNFVKGAQLAVGVGVALAMSAAFGKGANAMGGRRHIGHGEGHGGGKGASPSCFLAGTRIETPSGPVAIEELRIGDAVLTVSGEAKPVKWIGKQEASSEAPHKIAKFAIDGKAPLRDLYLTHYHAIYLDGFLVPAFNLVNGVTIFANAEAEQSTFTYYHVELETHEVILAEGLPVESFLWVGEIRFDNEDEYVRLYGPRTHSMVPFAPLLAYRKRKELASRARSTLACIYDMRRPLDKIRDRIEGRAELARAA